jgi:hypothetical protein
MSHRLLLMQRPPKKLIFPSGEGEITTLYRDPDYKTTSLPDVSGYRGNNTKGFGISSGVSESQITVGSSYNGYVYTQVYAGANNINFTSLIPINKWAYLYFKANGYTQSVNLSTVLLVFDDDISLTFQQAVESGYLSPLLLFSSSYSNVVSWGWIGWTQWLNLYQGGATEVTNFPSLMVYLKPLKQSIKGIIFTTNRSWPAQYDGFKAALLPSMQLSLSPIS